MFIYKNVLMFHLQFTFLRIGFYIMTTVIKYGRRIRGRIVTKISSVLTSSFSFSTSTTIVSTPQQQIPSQAQCVVIGKFVVYNICV